VPLLAAFMFALYGPADPLCRARDSAAVSFFWTGTSGAVAMTLVGLWFWEPMRAPDWGWMACCACTGALGHWLLIKCL
jgi:drug/metabolite transporter (DMT)-like permease